MKMIAIKDMEMPKGCQHCRFFRKHIFAIGLDYSYSCDLGATEFPMPWIRQMEERASDCPLVEIEERKVGKWVMPDKYYDKNIWRKCSVCNTHFEKYHKYVTFSGEVTYTEEIANFCKVCGAEMRECENG